MPNTKRDNQHVDPATPSPTSSRDDKKYKLFDVDNAGGVTRESDTAVAETPNFTTLIHPLNAAPGEQNAEESATILQHLIALGSGITDLKVTINSVHSDVRITQMTVTQIQSDINCLKTTVPRMENDFITLPGSLKLLSDRTDIIQTEVRTEQPKRKKKKNSGGSSSSTGRLQSQIQPEACLLT